ETGTEKNLVARHPGYACDMRRVLQEGDLVFDNTRQFLTAAAGMHDDQPSSGLSGYPCDIGLPLQPPDVIDDMGARLDRQPCRLGSKCIDRRSEERRVGKEVRTTWT